MSDRPRRAPVDFDLTGDNAGAASPALSADTPVQGHAPTPRLRQQPPPGEPSNRRSAREVIEAHLERARTGRVEDDLAENFASYVVRDGLIAAQTIHYIVRDEHGRPLN